MTLFAELKRRNVIRMAGLYLVTSWLLVQVGATLLPVFDAPGWVMKAIVVTLAVAFLPSLALAWVFEFTPRGVVREVNLPAANADTPRNTRGLDRAIIIVLALALGYFAFDKFVLSPRRDAILVAHATREGAAHAAATVAARGNSIAVLPLVNASNDPQQQFFSDGLSESLIDALSHFNGLRVIGRSSSFQFRNSREDARGIGAKLGVAYLLNGSVQHAGDVVRVRAEVVSTRDGTTVWTRQYDRPYRDLFALQDELTQAIAEVLKAKLLPGSNRVQGDRPPSGNLDAYNAQLKGTFNASLGSAQGFAQAIDDLTTATRLDPGYAWAWAKLARVHVARAVLGFSTDAAGDYALAEAAVSKALLLAPDLAEAHMSRAYWLENARLDWQGALKEYDRALELAPENAWVRFNAYGMRALMGQLDEPLRQIHAVLLDNPLESSWWLWYGGYLAADWRLDEATDAVQRSITLQPEAAGRWETLALIQIQRGDAKAALAAARREPPGVWQDIAEALALQIGPDRASADAALKALIAAHGDIAPYQIAQAQALRRDPEAMFHWLDRAKVDRDSALESLLIDPIMMRYKSDPRMAAFCARIGLPSPLHSQTRGI